ncbi:prothymosin alpha-like [Canis lupus familiaris]|uniref:prothymosin alpha-like n=1 Tax=Canis lupus familiaris TaxID=9615 RepID=UPI0002258175|nr:prothymosin alpha-like [Canis lupus familiaris]XP_038444764.1 prothymosin alpha-like [Canis lupus familiaris]|eukprot:XP_003435633.1 prothymosin alpha-like [Canis lupus familiaris]
MSEIVFLLSLTDLFCLALHSLAPTGCSEKPSLHCSQSGFQFTATTSAPLASRSFLAGVLELLLSFQSAATDHQRAPAKDTSSEITTKDLKEKKAVVEEAENGRDTPANGNANKANGEQEADSEVDEEEEEGGEEEEEEGDGEEEDGDEDEEAEAATGKWATEDDEDDKVDTKKQKTDEDD